MENHKFRENASDKTIRNFFNIRNNTPNKRYKPEDYTRLRREYYALMDANKKQQKENLSTKKTSRRIRIKENKESFAHLPQIETNEMYKKKKNFVRQVKIPYDVLITFHERHIYKDGNVYSGTAKETTQHREMFIASSIDNLRNQVDNEVKNMEYPIDESQRIRELDRNEYTIIKTPKYKKTNARDVPMREAKPYTASFLKHFNAIHPISHEKSNGECVIKYLETYWNVGKKFAMIKVFDEASMKFYGRRYKKKNGITARMIQYLCQVKNISCLGFDENNKEFVKHTLDRSKGKGNYKAIIFYMFMGHFYGISDTETILSITRASQSNSITTSNMSVVKDEEQKAKNTFVSACDLKFECDESNFNQCRMEAVLKVEPNTIVIFDQTNLNEEFDEYFRLTNDIPALKFSSITCVSEIYLKHKKIKLVVSASRTEGIDWREIQEICLKQNIEFKNQSFGSLILELMNSFYRTKRIPFSKELKAEILQFQSNKCMDCQIELKEGIACEIDHKRPISNGGDNSRENVQILCKSCHFDKSREEKENDEYSFSLDFESCLNLQSLEIMKSKLFLKCGFTMDVGEPMDSQYYEEFKMKTFCSDFNKCRRNILLYSKDPYCVFSILDNIEPFDGIITEGFYYIETTNLFPLRGNGFYSKPIIAYCLKKNIITLENIKKQFKPSSTVKSGYFNNFIDHMLKVFEGSEKAQKTGPNTLIGLFGRRDHQFYKYQVGNYDNIDDMAVHYQKLNKPYINKLENSQIALMTSEEEKTMLETYYPIYAQVLDIEAMELHKMFEKIKAEGGNPYNVKTDAVIYEHPYEIDFSNEYWDEEKKVKKIKNEENSMPSKRQVHLFNKQTLELETSTYIEYSNDEIYSDSSYDYIADRIIQSGKGCLILGPAGAGKTFLINKIINKLNLKDQEITKTVQVKKGGKMIDTKKTYKVSQILRVAPTNVSALLINGKTLDLFKSSFVNGSKSIQKKYGNLKYIFVDEISMVKEKFYRLLLSIKLARPDIKFIISGEFFQLPPVKEKLFPLKDPRLPINYFRFKYEKSRCLFELVDGMKLELTKCKRSDDTVFNNGTLIKNEITIDVSEYLKPIQLYKNVCFTNRKRMKINSVCMERFIKEHKPRQVAQFKKLTYSKYTQDMKICAGMPIQARINNKSLKIFNNEMYSVVSITDDIIKVKSEIIQEDEEKEIEIPRKQFNRLFVVAFCITIHKSQGATFDKPFVIHEWNLMDSCLKYVSYSRSSSNEFIHINLY